MRDDFPPKVKEALAKRAGYCCSNPDCGAPTVGPQKSADTGSVNLGRAAHITAASPGGPRYDPRLTRRQRRSQGNGIWLCAICADVVDKDEVGHCVELLRRWKEGAEAKARERLGKAQASTEGRDHLPDSLRTQLEKLIYRRLGWRGWLALMGLFGVGFVWWNWETVATRPGVARLLSWALEGPLPKADGRRFTIALSRLEGDERRANENLIAEALKDLDGVEFLRFNRAITASGPKPQEALRAAHEQAREYLRQSGAQVLLWGSVVIHEDRSVPKLYWTVSAPSRGAPVAGRYAPTADLALPEVFWNDLARVLRLLVVTQEMEFEARDGTFTAQRLQPFVEKVRSLLQSPESVRWQPQVRAQVAFALARSLQSIGDQTEAAEALKEALAVYHQALEGFLPKGPTSESGMVQLGIGNVESILGERERNITRLDAALAAYAEALKALPLDREPVGWAMTKLNVAVTLTVIAEQTAAVDRYEEAVGVSREVLANVRREDSPVLWALAKNELGVALMKVGEAQNRPQTIGEAIGELRQALEVVSRKERPIWWAGIQANLGSALSLAAGDSNPTLARQGVDALHEALKEIERDRAPREWGLVQEDLGRALARLAAYEHSTVSYEQATAAYQQALLEFSRERDPEKWAEIQSELGKAHLKRHLREPSGQSSQEAVAAFQRALTVYTRQEMPQEWRMTEILWAGAVLALDRADDRTLGQAAAALTEALRGVSRTTDPVLWSGCQHNLGSLLFRMAERETGSTRLKQAAAAYRRSLTIRAPQRSATDPAGTEAALGHTLSLLAVRGGKANVICEALASYVSAWTTLGSGKEATPYRAVLTTNVQHDVALVKKGFRPSEYSRCLGQYEDKFQTAE